MQPLNGDGIPVDIKIQPTGSNQEKRLSHFEMKSDLAKQLKILGFVQIILGALCIIAHSINMVLYITYEFNGLYRVGYGFWTGGLFAASGTFGIIAGIQRSRCPSILFHFVSIVSAFLTVALFSLALTSGLLCIINKQWVYTNDPNTGYYNGDGHYEYGSSKFPQAQMAAVALESLMVVVAIVEAIVAVRSSGAVRKTGISFFSFNDCCSPECASNLPPIHCQMESCFCHCAVNCHLPKNTNSNQQMTNGPEKFVIGGPLDMSKESNEKQSIMMDIKQPLPYPETFDQYQKMDSFHENQIEFSDRLKLTEA